MECNPDAPDPLWRVTNGLLVEELITGKKQLGDNTFEQDQPFVYNVVGDPGQDGLTYDELQPLLSYQPIPNGWIIIQTADASGQIGAEEHFASYGVKALDVGAPTHHTVAAVFWNFLNMTTTIEDDGQLVSGKLYDNPFYITGYPITEAYWTTARVNNQQTEVLFQCFERRCMTYTRVTRTSGKSSSATSVVIISSGGMVRIISCRNGFPELSASRCDCIDHACNAR